MPGLDSVREPIRDAILGDREQGTYRRIASRAGRFVPVLGPQSSFITLSTDIEPDSFQRTERSRVQDALDQLEREVHNWDMATDYGCEVCEQYVDSLRRNDLESVGVPGSDARADNDPLMVEFRAALVQLAIFLTRVWSRRLSASPEPMNSLYAAPITGDKDGWNDFTHRFVDVLNLCKRLERPRSDDTDTALLRRVRPRLLRLLAEIVGSSNSPFWAQERSVRLTRLKDAERGKYFARSFRDENGPVVDKYKQQITGMYFSAQATVPTIYEGAPGGVTLAHLIWLEQLIRHTLVSPTRAYRDDWELAFALSLYSEDVVGKAEDVSAGAIRLGLAEAALARTYDHPDVLTRVLRQCDDGARPTSAFHRSVARLARRNLEQLTRRAAEDPLGTPQQALILSISYDMEMEHALAAEFSDTGYGVLIPVERPNNTSRLGRDVVWIHLHIKDEKVEKTHLVDSATDHELDWTPSMGPIVVRLLGSPLQQTPKWSALSDDELASLHIGDDSRLKSSSMVNKVIIDERDLLDYLRYYSLPRDVATTIQGTSLFFFGASPREWSGRLQYYALGPGLIFRDEDVHGDVLAFVEDPHASLALQRSEVHRRRQRLQDVLESVYWEAEDGECHYV